MRFLYLTIIPLCYSLLYSCTQDDETHFEFKGEEDNEIVFQTRISAARGFVNQADLSQLGSSILLYGYHDESFLGSGEFALNGKELKYSNVENEDRWIIHIGGTPMKYYWEGYGDYKFFGWLNHDAMSGLSFPMTCTFDDATKKLTIPTTDIDRSYNQFDFLYSEVHERTLTADNMSEMKRVAVPMNMKHLFSAFGVGIRNTSEDDITIKNVAIYGLHERGNAEIDFSSSFSGANYTTSTLRNNNEAFTDYNNASGYTLPAQTGVKFNIFDPNATNKYYYMVWPQSADVLSPTTPVNNPSEPDREYAASDSILQIEYSVDGANFKKRMKLPYEAWEAGKKYYLEVQVADKLVEVITTVKDWEYTTSEVDFKEGSVLVKQDAHMVWDGSTCIVDTLARKVYVKNGQPVEGVFTIDAPEGGQWKASLEGDITAFYIIDDSAPTDDGFGPIDGIQHRLKIVPAISNPDRDYIVRLKFVAITADGKTLPADDMLQDYDNDDLADVHPIILQSVQ